MGIAVTCSKCNASFRVKAQHAGKRAKCPKCNQVLQIPASSPAAAAKKARPSTADLQREVLAAFRGEIEPVEVPIMYNLGILLVAVVMIVLPLVYVALIGLVGYLMYLFAIHGTGLLNVRAGRAILLAVLVYLAPLIVGGILILFMIKPLFARPAKPDKKRSLTRQGEPLLFAFVERVCAAVGAPQPRQIDVDCEVNASAGFRRGLLSMLGDDLVLTIGLPLVAGLNLRQFAGVLAHEFGHFTQDMGMRLTYVIRSISFWFTRVVYERDEWDERLTAWAKGLDLRVAWILYLARFFVWLTRRILWALMMIGHLVAGFMLRQMEYDADRHEARLAGSDAFEATARQLAVLGVATQGAHADLAQFHKDGRLGDNLPRLILANVRQIPAELLAELSKSLDETPTGSLDTHPAAKDRNASARRENAPGIFRLERPATVLFSDFAGLSRNVTRDFYREIFGPEFDASQIHPVDELLARQEKEQEADKALARYFQNMFALLRPIRLPRGRAGAPADPRGNIAMVKEARQRMLDAKPAYEKVFAAYHEADTQVIEADRAAALLNAQFRLDPSQYSIEVSSPTAVGRARTDAVHRQTEIGLKLDPFEETAATRLFAALQLVYVPQVAAKFENADIWQAEIDQILPALLVINRHAERFLQLRNTHAGLADLLANLEDNPENEALFGAIRSQMGEVLKHTIKLRAALAEVRYPFDHAKGEMSVAQYALEKLPADDNLGEIYEAGQELLATVHNLYIRLAGRLCMIGEQVELLLGLPQLPQPAAKEKPSPGPDGASES